MSVEFRSEGRSIPSLLGEIVRDLSDLIRQEVALAKTEASDKINHLQMALAGIAVGGAVAFAGVLVLLDACVYALANVMEPWVQRFPALPALIVGLGFALAGVIMLKLSVNRFSLKSLRLERTMASVNRDTDMVKEHLQ